MNPQLSHFVLKAGRVIDPAAGRDGMFDIRVRSGTIEAIGVDLAPEGAFVIDVKDHIVTPGLIDVHLHLMKGLGAFGVDPDIFGVGSGVTTVVDAGSAGHTLLNVFRNYVTDNARTRVLNYINLSTLGGVTGPGYSILADPRLIDEAKIEQAVEANRDIIVGIKIMATGGALGAQGLKPLERAQARRRAQIAVAGPYRRELDQRHRAGARGRCAQIFARRRYRHPHVHGSSRRFTRR